MVNVERIMEICKECIEKGTPIGTDAMSYGFWYDILELLDDRIGTKVIFNGFEPPTCGNCGFFLDKTYSYCPKCKKHLNWND